MNLIFWNVTVESFLKSPKMYLKTTIDKETSLIRWDHGKLINIKIKYSLLHFDQVQRAAYCRPEFIAVLINLKIFILHRNYYFR